MKKINLVDFLRTIRKGRTYYLKIDTMEIVNPFKYIERQIKDFDKMTWEEKNNLIFPSYEELNIYELPSYEEINHIEIRRFYVKNCIIDTKIRKELLNHTWNSLNKTFPNWKKNEILKKEKSAKNRYMRTVNRMTFPIYAFLFQFKG